MNSQTVELPSTPTAVRYGRKARINTKTATTSPLLRAGSAVKKKRNINNKKVVMMNGKERVEAKSKMKDIKTFFMRLSNDPKLELEQDGGGVRSDDVVAGE